MLQTTLIYGIILIGGLLVLGILLFYIFRSLSGANASQRGGVPAQATVLEVWDTGKPVNQITTRLGLTLRVSPLDIPSYETKTHVLISHLDPVVYKPGMLLTVRYDPKNPEKVTVDNEGSVESDGATPIVLNLGTFSTSGVVSSKAQQVLQSVLTDDDQDGVPDILRQPGVLQSSNIHVIDLGGKLSQQPGDPATRLQKLEQVRSAGMITEQEYQEKRAEILKEI